MKQVGFPKSTPPSKLDICFWSDRAISASRQNRLQAVSISKINVLGWTIENQRNAQMSLVGMQHGDTTDENNDDNIRHEFAEG